MPAFALFQNQNNIIESGLKGLRRSKVFLFIFSCYIYYMSDN